MTAGALGLAKTLSAACIGIVVLSSCAGSPPASGDWLADDRAYCHRLIAEFPVRLDVLREIVGPSLAPLESYGDDRGALRLEFIRCDASETFDIHPAAPLAFARVAIPLSAEQLPWRVAGNANTAWSSVALVVGDPGGRYLPFHERLEFTVMSGDVSLELDRNVESTFAEGVMRLADGYVKVEARLSGSLEVLQHVEAFLSARNSDASPLLGPHSMNRRVSGEATLETGGATPLSDLGLPARTQDVALDSDLRWRLRRWAPIAANASDFEEFVLRKRLPRPFNAIQVQTAFQPWLTVK